MEPINPNDLPSVHDQGYSAYAITLLDRFMDSQRFVDSPANSQPMTPAILSRSNKHKQYTVEDVDDDDLCRICFDLPEKIMFKCKLCKRKVHCHTCHVEMAFYYQRLKCTNCNQ